MKNLGTIHFIDQSEANGHFWVYVWTSRGEVPTIFVLKIVASKRNLLSALVDFV